MRILVTGSSGTIGSRLCEQWLAEGKHEVRGVDWVPNKWLPQVQAVTTIADMRDEAAVAGLPGFDADILIHLAANARVYELVEEPRRALDNFTTLFNALEFARMRGIKRFVFASSREGYGNISVDKYKEDMVRVEHCESPYTASKVGGEALVHAYARCYDMECVIIRFSNVYGMYDDSVRVIPQFFRWARANEPLTVFGKDKCLDFTYIDDAVDGVRLITEKFDAVAGETFNLAFGEGHTILELAETIVKSLGSTSVIDVGPSRTGEVIRYVADISHAKECLGYDPRVSFAEGVARAMDWYKKHA